MGCFLLGRESVCAWGGNGGRGEGRKAAHSLTSLSPGSEQAQTTQHLKCCCPQEPCTPASGSELEATTSQSSSSEGSKSQSQSPLMTHVLVSNLTSNLRTFCKSTPAHRDWCKGTEEVERCQRGYASIYIYSLCEAGINIHLG